MIYVNGRFLANPKMDGIKRFATEICKELKRQGFVFTIVIPKSVQFENEDNFEIIRYGYLKSHLWEQIDLLIFLKKKNNPLLLSFSGLAPLWYSEKIITIHDLSFFHEPKWFSWKYRIIYGFATPVIARNSRKILTVSNFSKKEIVKWLNVPSDKIEVVYNGVRNKNNIEHINESEGKRKYVLAVSSLDPRKNYNRLLEAFMLSELQGVLLLIVGKEAKVFKRDFFIRDYKNIQFLGHVNDTDLQQLYQNAQAFIYPSLYEGFGIPPIEAMSNGCAVIVSDIEVLREVCGDAALFVNPYSKKDIAENVINLVQNNILREDFKCKGIKQAEKYTWNKAAEKIIDIVRKNESPEHS